MCLVFAGLSGLFWFTSWPVYSPIPIPDDFPNCVSARCDTPYFAIGCLSHRRLSSLFLTTAYLEPGRAVWSERADGYFCGFLMPTAAFSDEPSGFNIHIGMKAIAWDCPYWLMAALWITMFLKTKGRFQYNIRDIFWTTTITAVAITLIRLKLALFCIVLINVCTAVLLFILVIHGIRALVNTNHLQWSSANNTESQSKEK
jgi:hypothetical protein